MTSFFIALQTEWQPVSCSVKDDAAAAAAAAAAHDDDSDEGSDKDKALSLTDQS